MKMIKLTWTLVFCLVLVGAVSVAQQDVEPVEFQKLSDRLYQIVGGRGAAGGAYIGDEGVLIIDAKMDRSSVDQVIAAVKRLTDKPIQYLVNTHSDGDHISGNQYFPQTTVIVAHENCRKEFFHTQRDGSESPWNDPEMAPFLPSVTYREQMNLYVGPAKVELWHFGVGHTKGDTVVYFPDDKTAFLGDQIFLNRPQLIHSYKGGNSFGHVRNLTKMLDTLDAERFCSGHSDVADRATIERHIEQMKARQQKIQGLVKQGRTLEQIQAEFSEDEGRLVESIFSEIKASKTD
jgi:glyoxylase-like metal-dependent hydrolase (beta-lactamase superfamily II)